MARPKKKISNPASSMDQLLKKAVELFQEPYDDRDERDADLPSLRTVAEELNTTILRTRKLLITAEYYSTETSRLVQTLTSESMGMEEIMEVTHLKHASINSYLPYKNLAFDLDQTTVNADRHKLFRQRVKSVNELEEHRGLPDEMEKLWLAVIAFEGYPFHTSGRGNRPGVKFFYTVSREAGTGGRHYSGDAVDGFGNEIKFSTKEKTVTRATVELAYRKAVEVQKKEGCVSGPKKIGLFGASYLYPMFLRFGVITKEAE